MTPLAGRVPLPVNVSGHVGVSLSLWIQIAVLVSVAALFALVGAYVGMAVTRMDARDDADRYVAGAEARRGLDQRGRRERATRALAAELDHIAGMGGSFRVLGTHIAFPRLEHAGIVADLPQPVAAAVRDASRSIDRFNAVAGSCNARGDSSRFDAAEVEATLDWLGAEAVGRAAVARDSLEGLPPGG